MILISSQNIKKGMKLFVETIFNWNKLIRVAPLVLKISKHWLSSIKKNQSTYQARIFLDHLVKNQYFTIKWFSETNLLEN